jgi:hypothetical protein
LRLCCSTNEHFLGLFNDDWLKVLRKLLEDLTLIQKPVQVPDFVLGEVQNVVSVKAKILNKEVDDCLCSFLD